MNFNWMLYPRFGTCVTCGSSTNVNGFVDLISEINITRENHEIVGNVDIVLCADCLTQASREIGCAPKNEVDDILESNIRWENMYNKAADEASAWQQRYENIVEIMSMIDPKNYVDSDTDIERLPTNIPSPDTRVQEGRDLPNPGDGKKQSSSKK